MLSLRLDAQGAAKGLQAIGGRYGGRMKDLTPATKDMGERMRFSIEENFRQSGRPTRWKPWAFSTALRRAYDKEGKPAGRLGGVLVRKGILKNSITYVADSSGLTVGTNIIYGRIHQLGGMAGRGRKVPIPARPFLVGQESDLEYFQQRILEHVSGA